MVLSGKQEGQGSRINRAHTQFQRKKSCSVCCVSYISVKTLKMRSKYADKQKITLYKSISYIITKRCSRARSHQFSLYLHSANLYELLLVCRRVLLCRTIMLCADASTSCAHLFRNVLDNVYLHLYRTDGFAKTSN